MKSDDIKYLTPEELTVLTSKKAKEISACFKKLKSKKPKQLDSFVHNLHEQGFDNFDCLECANCCKSLGPRITEKDIERLAKYLKLKPEAFIKQYIKIDEDNDYIFNQSPCPFLMPDNYCMVYDQRPKACREYPHTDRKRFYQVLNETEKNCETCPVVFSIVDSIIKQNW